MSPEKKIHLVTVEEPLLTLEHLSARCGYEFVVAESVWMFREDFRPDDNWLEAFNAIRVCRQCIKGLAEEEKSGRYLYGLIDIYHTGLFPRASEVA